MLEGEGPENCSPIKGVVYLMFSEGDQSVASKQRRWSLTRGTTLLRPPLLWCALMVAVGHVHIISVDHTVIMIIRLHNAPVCSRRASHIGSRNSFWSGAENGHFSLYIEESLLQLACWRIYLYNKA